MHLEKLQGVRVNELIRSPHRDYLLLDGTWQFELDECDVGELEKWYIKTVEFSDTITVPGCLESQGKGLQHLPLRQPDLVGGPDLPYLGVSWYKTNFRLPSDLEGKTVRLLFGGVATDCKVWLDGRLLGEHHFATIPFGFDITDLAAPGKEHHLVVRIENNHRYLPEEVTPQGFGESVREIKWSGIYRGVEVVIASNVYFSDLHIVPDVGKGQFICHYRFNQPVGEGEILAVLTEWDSQAAVAQKTLKLKKPSAKGKIAIAVPYPHLWQDTDPFLYRIDLYYCRSGTRIDSISERVGLREVTFDGTYVRLNGTPVYLRGDMVHYHWPDTISWPTDRNQIRSCLAVYKEYGFNFLRHHTFFPPPEYLDVCDELGLLCHNELGVTCHLKQEGLFDHSLLPELWAQSVMLARNHPSVIVWCLGNEVYPEEQELNLYRKLTYQLDPTRLLQSNSPGYFIFPDGTKKRAPVFHELRNAGASYVDVKIKNKYSGSLRPWRIQWAVEQATQSGLDSLLPTFTQNTQLLQARTRKICLEELRLQSTAFWDIYDYRGIPYQGFELCAFRDSGSFMWGVVDDFFGQKLESPQEVRAYINDTVLLWAQQWDHRVFSYGMDPPVVLTFLCSHYGKEPIKNGIFSWEIIDDQGVVLASDIIPGINVNCGELKLIHSDYYGLTSNPKPQSYQLRVKLVHKNEVITNSWPFWAFPEAAFAAENVMVGFANPLLKRTCALLCPRMVFNPYQLDKHTILITESVDETLLAHLQQGGRALLLGQGHFPGFVTSWEAGRSEFTRGTIIYDHPVMQAFPHQGWCDIPFAKLMNTPSHLDGRHPGMSFVYDLSAFPNELKPIIQGIPSYKAERPKKLAHLFEIQVGLGKLVVSTFNFSGWDMNLHRRKFMNCAGNYLLVEILNYMSGSQFKPEAAVSIDQFMRLVNMPRKRIQGEGSCCAASESDSEQ